MYEPYDQERLTDFWKSLAKQFPDVIGNRTYDTVFRIASEFARLMLKPSIDSIFDIARTHIFFYDNGM